MNKETYIKNPTKASSLSYFKTVLYENTPGLNISIVDETNDATLNKYFFKLVHFLKDISKPILPDGFSLTDISVEEYIKHINTCYDRISIAEDYFKEYDKYKVFDKDLCIALKDNITNEIVATCIALLDKNINEGIIDWIQVSKEYRGKGLGEYLVKEALYRLKDKASFVTVSGDMNNPCNPLGLYLKCGFTDKTIWLIEHI